MISVTFGLMIFFLSVVVHIWLHRLLKKRHIKTLKTCLIFLIGGLVNAGVMYFLIHNQNALSNETFNWWTLPLPLTSLFIYSLFSASYILVFIYPYSEQISPTYKIINLLQNQKALSEKDILNCFSNKELIFDRLQFLDRHGFIRKSGQYFIVLPKGKKYYRIINFYRRLINWDSGG